MRRHGKGWISAVAVGIGLTGWVGTMSAAPQENTAEKARFARFVASPTATVYAKFAGQQMWLAPKPEAIDKAVPVKAIRTDAGSGFVTFAATALPLAPECLPAGCAGVKATLSVYAAQPDQTQTYGQLALEFKDAEGIVWTYLSNVGGPTSDKPETAPEIRLPLAEKVTVAIETKPEGLELGVGIRPRLGATAISDILKGGKPVELEIAVSDAGKKLVQTAKKTISGAGFA